MKKIIKLRQCNGKEEKMEKIKITVIAIWSSIMSMLGILAIPVGLMVACNVIDYITGAIASKYRNEALDSYKGIKGIIKKVCMWLLVLVGWIIDMLLKYAGGTVGIEVPFNFLIACVVAIWIVCNEIISILENVNDIGVTLPPFLQPIVKNLKSQVENKTNIENKAESEEN